MASQLTEISLRQTRRGSQSGEHEISSLTLRDVSATVSETSIQRHELELTKKTWSTIAGIHLVCPEAA